MKDGLVTPCLEVRGLGECRGASFPLESGGKRPIQGGCHRNPSAQPFRSCRPVQGNLTVQPVAWERELSGYRAVGANNGLALPGQNPALHRGTERLLIPLLLRERHGEIALGWRGWASRPCRIFQGKQFPRASNSFLLPVMLLAMMGRIAVESAFKAKPLHKSSSSELQPYQQQHCNKDCPSEAQETWVRKKNQGTILGYHNGSSIFQNQQNYYNPILATLVFYKKQTKDSQ